MRLSVHVKTTDGADSKRLYLETILVAVLFLSLPASGADWEMRVTDNAAVEISHSQVPIVKADYCFWGKNWSYAGAKAQMGESQGSDKTFSGNVSALGLKLNGTVRSLASNKVRYTWNIDAGRDLEGIIGGGLEFRLVGDSPSLGASVSAPTLLANNTGWRWQVSDSGPIVVEFEKPCANVYFERGSKSQIRAMFVGQNLSKGLHTVSMTVTLPAGGTLLKYNYSQRTFGKPSRQGTWSTFSDVAITGMMPAAALLYRQGHLADAAKNYCIMLGKQELYMKSSHPKNMASLRTLVEQSKITIGLPDTKELDWDKQTKVRGAATVITDTDRDFIPAGRDFVRSDTGELTRNWVKGYQIIDTDKTQAVHGWVGGESLRLKHASFDMATPKAAVAVSSLDGEAIGESRRVLISAVARAVPSSGGRMPMLSEPVEGRIRIAGPPGLKLIPLAGDASKLRALNAEYSDGKYLVELPAQSGTHWFMLAAED